MIEKQINGRRQPFSNLGGPTYENKPAESGGTDLSLVTTGDKYDWDNKVDKVAGKGLSTNDYSDTEKGKVADNTSAIEAIVNEYGAKNLLNVTANNETKNGVTLTVNADKTVTLVTDSGGCTQNTAFRLSTPVLPIGKNMIFTDEIETYPDKVTAYYAQQVDGSWTTYSHNTEFTIGNHTDNACTIEVRAGALFTTPITFKPMIRDSRIADPTYAPYSMTNKELTDAVASKSVTVTPESGYALTFNHLRVANDILYGEIALFGTDNLPTREWVTIATCDIRPSHDIYTSLFSSAEGLSGGLMIIMQSGNIMVFQSYYDPIGNVTKKGAAGVFSSPL